MIECPPKGGTGHVGEQRSNVAAVESAETVPLIDVFSNGHSQPRSAFRSCSTPALLLDS